MCRNGYGTALLTLHKLMTLLNKLMIKTLLWQLCTLIKDPIVCYFKILPAF